MSRTQHQSVRRARCLLAGTFAALVLTQASLSAQLLPNPVLCPRATGESDYFWTKRCEAEEEAAERQRREEQARRVREARRATAETARQRAILEKQPPLPAARNPLLGRWESSMSRPSGDDPFAQVAAMLEGCGVLLGDGVVEFGPDRWAIYDADGRNDMGAISYRSGENGRVFGLPAQGSIFNLLPFEFESRDRIRLVGVVCTLKRTSATGARSTAASPAAAAPAAAAAAPQHPAPRSPAARSKLERWRGRMGYDCPDGVDVAIDRCAGEADDSMCVVARVNHPLKDGVEVTFTETRGALVKRIASCKLRPLMVLRGELEFAP